MAEDINTITIAGRLTREAELQYSISGFAILKFSIANNQSKKTGDSWDNCAHFFDAVMFGRRADALHRYMKKGLQVVITGTLQQNRWKDKVDGQNRSRIQIVVENIQLFGGKISGESQAAPHPAKEKPAPPYDENFAADGDNFDDEIPF